MKSLHGPAPATAGSKNSRAIVSPGMAARAARFKERQDEVEVLAGFFTLRRAYF